MSVLWPKVYKQNRCPICDGADWLCRFGDRAVLCMRVESDHECPSGGWYHHRIVHRPESKPVPPRAQINAAEIYREMYFQTEDAMRFDLAGQLGVMVSALQSISCAWAYDYGAWAFPMRDYAGNIIGIRLRSKGGYKWAVPGSFTGIFLPKGIEQQRTVYLTEGPTSTAAALTLGLFAIGRPNCNSGDEIIRAALDRLGIYRAVIVADNDDQQKTCPKCKGCGCENCEQTGLIMLRPGFDGAMKLKKHLKIRSVIWTPPTKDIRDFLIEGGTRAVIESEVKELK